MVRDGALHVAQLNGKYFLYFAPYEGSLDALPQRTCHSTAELEAVLSGLGFDNLERLRVVAEVQRDSARTVPNVHTTDDRLRELGF